MGKTAARIARLRAWLLTRPAKIIGALLVLYAVCGFLVAPWLVRQQLPGLLDKHLGAQGSVGTIRINPFLLTFDATDLAIAEKGGLPVFGAGRIWVDFELGSLLRWAWTFSEIRIEQPVLNVDLDARESLNLERLLKPLQSPEKTGAETAMPRLLLQHFVITGGVFKFTDHTLQPEARTQINPINFEIRDVSTLPDHQGEHRLNARLPGGGNLQWQGRLSLSPIQSSGALTLTDARLSTPWQFVRDHLTIAEPQGTYDFSGRYQLGYAGGALDVQADALNFGLKGVVLTQQQDGALLGKLGALAVEGGSFNLAQRSLTFRDVRVADGIFNVILDEDSVPDWAKLVRSSPSTAQPASAQKPASESAAATAPWQISLPKISLGPLALSLTDHSRAKPLRMSIADTRLTLGAAAMIGDETQVTINDGTLKASNIRIMSGDEKDSPLTLDTIDLTGGAFDLQKKTVYAALVRLSGGRALLLRNADGSLQLLGIFAPRKQKPLQEAGLSLTLDRAEIAGYTVALTDRSFDPAIAYDLEQINASASRIALPPVKTPSPVELSLRVKQGGSVKAKGLIDMRRQTADVRLEAGDLALTPLDSILKRETTLTLASGKAGANGRVTVDGRTEPPAIRYTGAATITELDLKVAAGNDRLLGLKRLEMADIDYSSAENRIAVARLSLAEPYAKLIINKDRSTNLAAIPRAKPGAGAAAGQAAESAATAPPAISIERVSIDSGTMDFADLSLVLPFATYIKSLNGSVSGLSSAADSRASLKFEGTVSDYGLARAEGSIRPFAPRTFTDITVAFRNLELIPLSPYTATFAGRKIASGRLSLDLQYKLDNSKLAGDNKVLLERFTLGERVESPTAVNLPLDLAIALLTDSDGKIDLAVPVSGDVDHPEFSYGHVIWQAIRTVITRIVTAPFRALGSLFGGNAETLGDIVFDPGSSRILPTEQEKLQRVAEGLQKRPQLKLLVQGQYDKDADSVALRTRAVRMDLAAREGLKLAAGEDPGPIGFDNAKTQRALENMLDARAGGDAVAQFAEAYRKSTGRDAARVNAALAMVGRGAGDRALYVALHQRLVELQPLPAPALAELGKARADAISKAFTERLKFDPARLGGKPVAAAGEVAKNGVPAKLSFEPVK